MYDLIASKQILSRHLNIQGKVLKTRRRVQVKSQLLSQCLHSLQELLLTKPVQKTYTNCKNWPE